MEATPVAKEPETGLRAVSIRALRAALNGYGGDVASEMAWLDDGQIKRLVVVLTEIRDAAQAELAGRSPR
jgi:hypothetical protein